MKIYLQGFKSIREPQCVAIGGKLTFLVGPNSAGKSVLLQALNKLSGEAPGFDFDSSQIHRNPNNNTISGVHGLGVEWIQDGAEIGYYADFAAQNLLDEHLKIDCLGLSEVDIPVDVDSFEDHGYGARTVVRLGGGVQIILKKAMNARFRGRLILAEMTSGEKKIYERQLVRLEKEQNIITIHLQGAEARDRERLKKCMDWAIEILNPEGIFEGRVKPIVSSSSESEIEDGVRGYARYLGSLLDVGIIDWHFNIIEFQLRQVYSGKSRQRVLNRLEKYHSIIKRYKDKVVRLASKEYPGRQFKTVVVPAQRTLPISDDLNAIVGGVPTQNIYHHLMCSAAADEWNVSFIDELLLTFDQRQRTIGLESVFKAVNRALSESLFSDNGYQVQVRSQALIAKTTWERAAQTDPDKPPIARFSCTMSLVDAYGRTLSFDEVGSGIGYVLPVLIESFSSKNINKVLFLQQPELHLHPALQASLTDVLIEAGATRKIVAETHSEHLILRALKRIRQTSNGTLMDVGLALKPDDVAVNYFEPLPDGSTKVHILRVSDDGDFIDRWPGGFFAERDRELFDE